MMPARPIPKRHWRSYSDHLLPTGAEALGKPLRAFPSWFLGEGDMLIRDILDRTRHGGCGGRAGKAELLTGIEGSSRPIRRIVVVERSTALL
jgi:hypothetical protein